jgi:hypothetical protein
LQWPAIALAAQAVVLGALFVVRGGNATPIPPGDRVLLIAFGDKALPVVGDTIESFEASGFRVTDNVQAAMVLLDSPDLTAFFVTRASFGAVPAGRWQSLYESHVLVGGLDVSLHELQPLTRPGAPVGSARLEYTPDRPIFAFLHSRGNCGSGAMSDWLDNWRNLSAVVEGRVREISRSESAEVSAYPSDCPPVRPTAP